MAVLTFRLGDVLPDAAAFFLFGMSTSKSGPKPSVFNTCDFGNVLPATTARTDLSSDSLFFDLVSSSLLLSEF